MCPCGDGVSGDSALEQSSLDQKAVSIYVDFEPIKFLSGDFLA
jgi:hypothetical protein